MEPLKKVVRRATNAGLLPARRGNGDVVVREPGLDLHEWETRWQELQDLAAESPAETLPEIARLIEQMLTERGYDLANPVIVENEDPDIVRDFLAARELVAACQAGTATAGDTAAALENLREIHDYLVQDRPA
jgi:DNA-binding FadR family transcriptional regulator